MSERRQHGVPGPRERAGVADAERKEGYTPHERRGLGPHLAQDLSGARSCVCACVCVRARAWACVRARVRAGASAGFILELFSSKLQLPVCKGPGGKCGVVSRGMAPRRWFG